MSVFKLASKSYLSIPLTPTLPLFSEKYNCSAGVYFLYFLFCSDTIKSTLVSLGKKLVFIAI